jgi:hypothetical protein
VKNAKIIHAQRKNRPALAEQWLDEKKETFGKSD